MSNLPHGSSAILPASVTGRGGYEAQVETCICCQRDFELDPNNGRYYFSTDGQLGAITPTQTPAGWVCNEDEEDFDAEARALAAEDEAIHYREAMLDAGRGHLLGGGW